jgi:hypothetical protein
MNVLKMTIFDVPDVDSPFEKDPYIGYTTQTYLRQSPFLFVKTAMKKFQQ